MNGRLLMISRRPVLSGDLPREQNTWGVKDAWPRLDSNEPLPQKMPASARGLGVGVSIRGLMAKKSVHLLHINIAHEAVERTNYPGPVPGLTQTNCAESLVDIRSVGSLAKEASQVHSSVIIRVLGLWTLDLYCANQWQSGSLNLLNVTPHVCICVDIGPWTHFLLRPILLPNSWPRAKRLSASPSTPHPRHAVKDDNDFAIAIFVMGLVGAGTNNARLAQMSRCYYYKGPDCLLMVCGDADGLDDTKQSVTGTSHTAKMGAKQIKTEEHIWVGNITIPPHASTALPTVPEHERRSDAKITMQPEEGLNCIPTFADISAHLIPRGERGQCSLRESLDVTFEVRLV
ncbi:hypothetical protein B0H13DRAFT_1870412 [Mycena leptocephala]|nr:hypothetical protein B0H13DRAFT_1870412 [Mycena leptocephala]